MVLAFLAQTRQPQLITGNVVVQVIGTFFFFMRAYSRVVITKTWRAEDNLLAVAAVSRQLPSIEEDEGLTQRQLLATGWSVTQYGQIAHGAGRHRAALIEINPENPVESQKYAFAAQIILFPALAVPKLSICSAYLRIFYTDVIGHRLIQALVVLLILSIVPFDFEVIFQCKPIHVYWSEGRPDSKCLADIPGFFVNGALNIFADVALMAIVLPRVLQLQLHKRQRWALVTVISVGSLAALAGIARMVRVSAIFKKPDFDPSWDSYDVSLWTTAEIYVSLICASAPGIKPVIVRIMPKLLGSSFHSQTRRTAFPSIELGSKWKRNTTSGGGNLQRQTSETALAIGAGPYTECGRGADAESTGDDTSVRPSRRGSEEDGIYKTSVISVEVSTR
jgi:hypothetical protein